MAMKFRTNKSGKAHPIYPKVQHVKIQRGGMFTFNDPELAVNDSLLTKTAFEQQLYMSNNERAIKIKRGIVQAANRARVMSRDPRRSEEERANLTKIADQYDKIKNQMVVPKTTALQDQRIDEIKDYNYVKQVKTTITKGTVTVKADTNDGVKTYKITKDGKLSFAGVKPHKMESKWFKGDVYAMPLKDFLETKKYEKGLKKPLALRTKVVNGQVYSQYYNKDVQPNELD